METSCTRSPPLRWGVLGAARILGKLAPAIRAAGGHLVAIGASTRERAREGARQHGIERALGGYQEVLDDPDVDAVYLPLANGLHRRWLLAAADAGKHCLGEKPLTLSAADARDICGRFRAAGGCVQEAFMWRHHPQAEWLSAQLTQGALGEPLRVHAAFSFPLDRPDDYRWSAAMGGGALWDIGCYGVNAARYFFRAEPVAASFRARFRGGPGGVDESASGWLDFGDGRTATVSCSFASAFAQGLEVVGREGSARLDRPWLSVDTPTEIVTQRGYDRSVQRFDAVNAYASMVLHFTRIAQSTQEDAWPAEDGLAQAVALAGVLESARAAGRVWSAA